MATPSVKTLQESLRISEASAQRLKQEMARYDADKTNPLWLEGVWIVAEVALKGNLDAFHRLYRYGQYLSEGCYYIRRKTAGQKTLFLIKGKLVVMSVKEWFAKEGRDVWDHALTDITAHPVVWKRGKLYRDKRRFDDKERIYGPELPYDVLL